MLKRRILSLAMAALAVPLLHGQASAQDDGDGPGRGVARLSLMNGDVSVRRGDSGDWVAAVINAPLMVEDRVLTGAGSRGEVQFDYYHRLRLAEDSEVRFSELEYGKYQVQVARGTVTLSALKGGDAQIELATPAAAVRPLAHGQYRVTVRQDGAVEITVRSGEAEIFTPSGTEKLRPGRTMVARMTPQGGEFQMVAAIGKDRWDQFNEQRDRDLQRSRAYQYVSRDIYGAEDLDGHGQWVYAAPYGYVWAPAVAPGWAPYRHGRWSWLDWYGWSWVSYDPWGWAPYHYGRWFHHGGRWCWWPGAGIGVGYRHYWSPGLVAWFGFGSPGFGFGVNVGFGFGNWGWVPLAPYEPFHRWWGPRYYGGYRNHTTIVNNVRVVNNTNIYNNYRNARVGNGVSVLDGGDFTRGSGGRAWRNNDGEISRASLMQGALPATPGRNNLQYTDRAARAPVAGREARGSDQFYSRRQAASVERVPFEQQRQALERVARSPESRSSVAQGSEGRRSLETGGDGPRGAASRNESPAVGARTERTEDRGAGWRRAESPAGADARPEQGGRSYGSGDAWRRFGEPRTETAPQRAESPARQAETTDRSGWRSFGDPGRGGGSTESVVRETPRSEMPRNEGSRGTWSTGAGRSELQRQETPRSEGSRGSWSTGGGRGESQRQETPRSEGSRGSWSTGSGRSESPRMERSEPSRGSEPQRQEASPSRRGGSDMSGFGRGSWSTGGGRSSTDSFNSGGSRSSSPSYTPSYGGGRGSGSTGGDSGMRSSPRMSAPRGGGYSSPSMGGYSGGGGSIGSGRSSGGYSGGGGYSGSRGSSSGGMSSGGGGGRTSGGGGGGGRSGGGGGRPR